MEEKILQELQEMKKELQDIHSILEPKKINSFKFGQLKDKTFKDLKNENFTW